MGITNSRPGNTTPATAASAENPSAGNNDVANRANYIDPSIDQRLLLFANSMYGQLIRATEESHSAENTEQPAASASDEMPSDNRQYHTDMVFNNIMNQLYILGRAPRQYDFVSGNTANNLFRIFQTNDIAQPFQAAIDAHTNNADQMGEEARTTLIAHILTATDRFRDRLFHTLANQTSAMDIYRVLMSYRIMLGMSALNITSLPIPTASDEENRDEFEHDFNMPFPNGRVDEDDADEMRNFVSGYMTRMRERFQQTLNIVGQIGEEASARGIAHILREAQEVITSATGTPANPINDDPDFHRLFTLLALGTPSTMRSAFNSIPDAPPLNTESFSARVPVADIPKEKRIYLDGYRFDIDELVAYAQNDLHKLFINPHVDNNRNMEFSDNAKSTMRNNPQLAPYVNELEHRMQSTGILAETVDKMIVMLTQIESAMEQQRLEIDNDFLIENYLQHMDEERYPVPVACEVAVSDFKFYKNNLPLEERTKLNNYIIRVPFQFGGMFPFPFNTALGLNNGSTQCIQNLQIYGWQFVVTLRPEAMSLVPPNVLTMARRYGKIIRPHLPLEAAIANVQENGGADRAPFQILGRMGRHADASALPMGMGVRSQVIIPDALFTNPNGLFYRPPSMPSQPAAQSAPEQRPFATGQTLGSAGSSRLFTIISISPASRWPRVDMDGNSSLPQPGW
jgi:hypothetical protein